MLTQKKKTHLAELQRMASSKENTKGVVCCELSFVIDDSTFNHWLHYVPIGAQSLLAVCEAEEWVLWVDVHEGSRETVMELLGFLDIWS